MSMLPVSQTSLWEVVDITHRFMLISAMHQRLQASEKAHCAMYTKNSAAKKHGAFHVLPEVLASVLMSLPLMSPATTVVDLLCPGT